MRLDTHNHAFPNPAVELLSRSTDYGVSVVEGRLEGGFMHGLEITPAFSSAAAKLADLEAQGLEGAVLSAAPSLFCYELAPELGETVARVTNEGLASMCAERPGRLSWLATVPMQEPSRAVKVLEEAVRAGCVGVEIGTSVSGRPLDDDRFTPFWAAVDAARLGVMLHPATGASNPGLDGYHLRNVVGHPLETTIAAERLICSCLLDRYPSVKVLLVHGGGAFPYVAGRLEHARSVRAELSGAPTDPWAYVGRLMFDSLTHDLAALRYLIEKAGSANVVVGTDLPFDMAERDSFRLLVAAGGGEAARQIAEDSPRALFPLLARV